MPFATTEDLYQHLVHGSDAEVIPWLIQGLIGAAGLSLNFHLEMINSDQMSVNLVGATLERKTPHAFDALVEAFPLAAHVPTWRTALAEIKVEHSWDAYDSSVEHHAHGHSGLYRVADDTSSWAFARVLATELALGKMRPDLAIHQPTLVLERVNQALVRYAHAAGTNAWHAQRNDRISAEQRAKTRTVAFDVIQRKWQAALQAEQLTGQTLSAASLGVIAAYPDVPNDGRSYDATRDANWIGVAAVSDDSQLIRALGERLDRMPLAERTPLLMSWMDLAAQKGSAAQLAIVLARPDVQDLTWPARPGRPEGTLNQMIAWELAQPCSAWAPSEAMLTAHLRQGTVAKAPATLSRPRPRA